MENNLFAQFKHYLYPPAGSFTAQRIPRFIAHWIFPEMASDRVEAAVAANYIFNDKTM
jgi:hypothetical protein